ncbi:conserved hypothetical protein [Streptococcus equi subsp. zooepidemicus ATCC 35246]|nr:conserved hypothetical protein [Streptococcus equi subsp. zooepidemicus ATCC 35246]AIA68968.1 hypothetical protein Q426_09490 [Streptococcus equi subsp. zooepidemicus CY]
MPFLEGITLKSIQYDLIISLALKYHKAKKQIARASKLSFLIMV